MKNILGIFALLGVAGSAFAQEAPVQVDRRGRLVQAVGAVTGKVLSTQGGFSQVELQVPVTYANPCAVPDAQDLLVSDVKVDTQHVVMLVDASAARVCTMEYDPTPMVYSLEVTVGEIRNSQGPQVVVNGVAAVIK